MNLELTDEQTEALIRELSQIIDGDRYPLSPRIRVLKEILRIMRPEPAPPGTAAPATALRAAEQGTVCTATIASDRPLMRRSVRPEAQLVAVTRRLVRATWLLVVVGFLSFGASVAQFFILRSSDQKTDKVISAMQQQATIMEGQIAITEAQLRPRMSLTLELSGDVKDANGGKSFNGQIVTPV
jgi:hypothetical protein